MPRNIKMIQSQSGIPLLFMLVRKGEKRIVRNPEKKRIARTDVRRERV